MTDLQVGAVLGGGGALLVVGTLAYRWARYEMAREVHRAARVALPLARTARWRAFGRLLSVGTFAVVLVMVIAWMVGHPQR
jgi:hypothetical protein